MPDVAVAAPVRGFLLDGEWITAGEPALVRSPYNGSVVGSVSLAGAAHVEQAVAAAVRDFVVTRKLPAYERRRILTGIAQAIAARKGEFARTIALEAGKPIRTARAEVERAVFTFTVAAEEATRIGGEVLPLDLQPSTAGRWGMVRRFPLGPILAITPFNFPLNLVAHKLAPAIAAGCPVVLKPAPQTPLTALLLAECVQGTGWPKGALHVLPLSNDDAARLVRDDRLKMLTFTGSTAVGWALKAQAGKKKVLLELGGNAGVIVHSDAEIEYAAERCVAGGFSYAGQSCIAAQRILVHRSIFDRFVAAFLERVRRLATGDPLDEHTDVGPLIRESDAVRVLEWVDEAVRGGAKVLCGGTRRGPVVQPTVLTGTSATMHVNCAEVFGPVKTVEPYDDFDAALRAVNDSPFGLHAGIFTRDARLLFKAYDELEVGGVVAGDVPTFRIDHMPYGGIKDSGFGREGLRYAIEEMTEPKLLVLAIGR